MASPCVKNAHLIATRILSESLESKEALDFLLRRSKEIEAKRASNAILSKATDPVAKKAFVQNIEDIARAKRDIDAFSLSLALKDRASLDQFIWSLNNQWLTESANLLAFVSDFKLWYQKFFKQPENSIFKRALDTIYGKPVSGRDFRKLTKNLEEITLKRFAFNFSSKKNWGIFPHVSPLKDEVNKFFQWGTDVFDEFTSVNDVIKKMKKDVSGVKADRTIDSLIRWVKRVKGVNNLEKYIYDNLQNIFSKTNDTKAIASFIQAYNVSLAKAVDAWAPKVYSNITTLFQNFSRFMENGVTSEPAAMQYAFGYNMLQKLGISVEPRLFWRGKAKKFSYMQWAKSFMDDLLLHTKQYLNGKTITFRKWGKQDEIAPSLKWFIDEKSNVPIRDQFEEKMATILQILWWSNESLIDWRTLNRLKEIALWDPTMRNILDWVDTLIAKKLWDNVSMSKLSREFASIQGDINNLINSNVEALAKEVWEVRTPRDVIRYVLDNPLLADEGVVFFDAQRLSTDPVNRASQKLSEEWFRYGINLPGVIEKSFSHDTSKQFLKEMKAGKVKSVVLQNEFSVDKMGDIYKKIKDYNVGKEEADRVRLIFPTGKQTYSFFYDPKQGLSVRTQTKRDAMQLQENTKWLWVEFEEFQLSKTDSLYEEYFAQKLDAEFDWDIDLAREAYREEFWSMSHNEAKRRMSYIYSVSDYKVSNSLVNTQVERIKVSMMDEAVIKHESERIVGEMWIAWARWENGIASVNIENFVITDRPKLNRIIFGMNNSQSVQEKLTLRKAFLEEVGVLERNTKLEFDSNIHVLEDAVTSMERDAIGFPVFFGTNKVLNWLGINTEGIDKLISTGKGLNTIPKDVQEFMHWFIAKNKNRYGWPSYRENLEVNMGSAMSDINKYIGQSSTKSYNIEKEVTSILDKYDKFKRYEFLVTDNTDKVYEKYMKSNLEPGNVSDARKSIKTFENKDNEIFNILDDYRRISDNITESTPYTDILDLKRKFTELVDKYEQDLLKRYKWVMHSSEFSSKKSNVFILDRVWGKEDFNKAIDNLDDSYKALLADVNDKKISLEAKWSLEEIASKKYEDLLNEEKGFYTTVVDGETVTVSLDDELSHVLSKIPGWVSEQIDSLKVIDTTFLSHAEKAQMYKVSKIVESAVFDNARDIVGWFRSRTMPVLSEFYKRYAEVSVKVNQDTIIKKDFWRFWLPEELVWRDHLKVVFDDIGSESSRSLDLLVKRQIYEDVSVVVKQAKDLDLPKIINKAINKSLKSYVDAPTASSIKKSKKLKQYKDDLLVDFRPYEAVVTLDMPDNLVNTLKKDLDRRSTINDFITADDRNVLAGIDVMTSEGQTNLLNYSIRSSDEVIDDVRYLSTWNKIQPVAAAKVELKKTIDNQVVVQSQEYTQSLIMTAWEAEAKARRLLNAGDVRAVMKKTTNFTNVYDNIILPLTEMVFKEEWSPFIALRNLTTMSVEDQKLFRSYYSDQSRGVYVPSSDASIPEKYAADVYRYMESWRQGMLDVAETTEIEEGIKNIHGAMSKKQDYEHLSNLVEQNRVFELVPLGNKTIKPKMFSDYKMTNNPKLSEEKYSYWRESFVKESERSLVKDKDIQLIYDTYASRGYISRLKRILSMQYTWDNKLLRALSMTVWQWARKTERVLGGMARAILQVPGYVGPLIYDKLLEQKDLSGMKEIYDEISWGKGAGPTLSNVFNLRYDDNIIQKGEKMFDTFLKKSDNPQVHALIEEMGGWLNQLVDIMFRWYVKDKSFYDALKAIPTKHTENPQAFLDFVKNAPDTLYKRDLVKKVKQTATRNFDLNSWFHLSRWSQRNNRGRLAMTWDMVDFRWSWGRMMVTNFFSELFSPIVAAGWVWTDVASKMIRGKYEGIGWFRTALSDWFTATNKIMWNNAEFQTAWITLMRNAYRSNKISRILSEDYADPDREESVFDESLDIMKALKWFYTPLIALDTSYPGRTLQTYIQWAYEGNMWKAAFDNMSSFVQSMWRQFRAFNAIPVLMKQFQSGDLMSQETVNWVFSKVGWWAYNYYADYSEGYYGESVVPMSKFGMLSMVFWDNIWSPKETLYDISSDIAYQRFLSLFDRSKKAEDQSKYFNDYLIYDIWYKLPIVNVALRVWRDSASIQEGKFKDLENIAETDPVYQSMVKDGVLDMDLVRQKLNSMWKPLAYQEILKEFDKKLTRYKWLPWEGNFTEIFNGLQSIEWTSNPIFKSFTRALDWEGDPGTFYAEMLSLPGKRKDRQLREIQEVLHVARWSWDLNEDAFIGASRTLLWYWYDIRKDEYESDFAAQNKKLWIKWGKQSLSTTQKNLAIERALKDAWEHLPETDINEAIDMYSEYAAVAFPEIRPFLNIQEKESYGIPYTDTSFQWVRSRAMAAEYMYDQCLSQGNIDCIGKYKNMFGRSGSFLPKEELVEIALVNNAFDKIDEDPNMSYYDKMTAKWSIIINNRELVDIAENLKETATEEESKVIDWAVSRWFWTMKWLTKIVENWVEMNDADKAKSNWSFTWLWKVKIEDLSKIYKPLKNIVNSRTKLFNPNLIKDVGSSNAARYFPRTKREIMSGAMKRAQNSGAATAAKSESFIKWRKPTGSWSRGTKIRKVKKQRKPKVKKWGTSK